MKNPGNMKKSHDHHTPFGTEVQGRPTGNQGVRCAGQQAGRSFPAVAIGAMALGALALGALSIGAVAVGRMVVGRLLVKWARIGKLEIGTLTIGKLDVADPTKRPDARGASDG
jgi:hypothetical protein